MRRLDSRFPALATVHLHRAGALTLLLVAACATDAGAPGTPEVTASTTEALFASAVPWSSQPSDANGWKNEIYANSLRLADVDGDGKADLCGRGSAGLVCARSLGGGSFDLMQSMDGSWASDQRWSDTNDGGIWTDLSHVNTIQFADINADGKADVCARKADGVYCAYSNGFPANGSPNGFTTLFRWSRDYADYTYIYLNGIQIPIATVWTQPSYYNTMRLADVDGDGRADLCARDTDGVHCSLSTGAGFATRRAWSTTATDPGAAFSDAHGWNSAPYANTIMLADINGDLRADLCGRGAAGVSCALAIDPNGTGWGTQFGPMILRAPDQFHDASGWAQPQYFNTLRLADVDGDGLADLCGRGAAGIWCAKSQGTFFDAALLWNADFSDANGWSTDPAYYNTIMFGDIDNASTDFWWPGTPGLVEVCGRGGSGVWCATSQQTRKAWDLVSRGNQDWFAADPVWEYQILGSGTRADPWNNQWSASSVCYNASENPNNLPIQTTQAPRWDHNGVWCGHQDSCANTGWYGRLEYVNNLAVYTGDLDFASHDGLYDTDYSWNVYMPRRQGYNNGGNGIHIEWNDDHEGFTDDDWGWGAGPDATAFWSEIHSLGTEYDIWKWRYPCVNIGAINNRMRVGTSGGRMPLAQIIGIPSLDCAHNGSRELHPTFAMAIRTHEAAVSGYDQWEYFYKNYGDNGWAGSTMFALDKPGNRGQLWFPLPAAPAGQRISGATIDMPEAMYWYEGSNDPGYGFDAAWFVPGQGVVFETTVPNGSSVHSGRSGTVRIFWQYTTDMQQSGTTVQLLSKKTPVDGTATGAQDAPLSTLPPKAIRANAKAAVRSSQPGGSAAAPRLSGRLPVRHDTSSFGEGGPAQVAIDHAGSAKIRAERELQVRHLRAAGHSVGEIEREAEREAR